MRDILSKVIPYILQFLMNTELSTSFTLILFSLYSVRRTLDNLATAPLATVKIPQLGITIFAAAPEEEE